MRNIRRSYFLFLFIIALILVSLVIADKFYASNTNSVKADEVIDDKSNEPGPCDKKPLDPFCEKEEVPKPDLKIAQSIGEQLIKGFCSPEFGGMGSGKISRTPTGVDVACMSGHDIIKSIKVFDKNPELLLGALGHLKTATPISNAILNFLGDSGKKDLDKVMALISDYLAKIKNPNNGGQVCKPTPTQIQDRRDKRIKPPVGGGVCDRVRLDCPGDGLGDSIISQGPSIYGYTTGYNPGYISSVEGYMPGFVSCTEPFDMGRYFQEVNAGQTRDKVKKTNPPFNFVDLSGAGDGVTEQVFACVIVKSLVPCAKVTKAQAGSLLLYFGFASPSNNSDDTQGVLVGAVPGQHIHIDAGKGGQAVDIIVPGKPGTMIGGGITVGGGLTIQNAGFQSYKVTDGSPVVDPTQGASQDVRIFPSTTTPDMCEVYTRLSTSSSIIGGASNGGRTLPVSIAPIFKESDIPQKDSFSGILRTSGSEASMTGLPITILKKEDSSGYYFNVTDSKTQCGNGGDVRIPSKDPKLMLCRDPRNPSKPPEPANVLLGYFSGCTQKDPNCNPKTTKCELIGNIITATSVSV